MHRADTLKDLLVAACNSRKDAIAVRHKKDGEWYTFSYRDLLARTHRVSTFLRSRGLCGGDRIGIFLENCPEWPEVYFGIVCAGLTAVPLDAKLRAQEVAHILRDADCRLVFASTQTYRVIRETETHFAGLSGVVLLGDRLPPSDKSSGTEYLSYAAAARAGDPVQAAEGERSDALQPTPSAAASIIYTSGTTGHPKGAVLTHGNFCSNVQACVETVKGILERDERENFLLVLPLHHAFAFTANLLLPLALGAEISFVESLKTVGDNLRELSPTILLAVPLLIEKMYARIMGGLKKKQFAYLLFRAGLKAPIVKGVRKALGGSLKLVVSGGAPACVDVLNGFGALGVRIVEGYGLTETSPVLTLNPPDNVRPGTVGKPVPGVALRIDQPNAEGVGEIVARGPSIMAGYYNNPAATAEVIRDGWFHTGDLGSMDGEGYLTISGRLKNLIVNREGKNIYPEEVEQQVSLSRFVEESLVFGYREAGQTGERVGLVVVPNQDAIDAHAAEHKRVMSEADVEDLIRSDVRKKVSALAEYKRPRRIQVRTEEFEKTSTGKIKRYLYTGSPKEI